ncbi:MAG TPA: hypothetical protein VNC22_17015 [Sporichthya sp.]|jgi:lipoate-protein ligase A|nr:hypothetical protein [Sporichthya sp.]
MRVVDVGTTSGLRSQSIWHALAESARPGDAPTLSFVRPAEPYVCLGYHRDLRELDLDHCERAGLPVYRRLIGGGPVYLDPDQIFFQLSLPAAAVRGSRAAALRALLGPAVRALRDVGVDAQLDRFGEICVGEAKVCGHGAGQIGDGVVVVGNLIRRFDHVAAARVLSVAADVRPLLICLMRRHIEPTPVEVDAWKAAMVRSYAEHLRCAPAPAAPTAAEWTAVDRFDARLARPDFVAGAERAPGTVRTVKVRAGVWVHDWTASDGRLVVAVADGLVTHSWGEGGVAGAASGLRGLPVATARARISSFPAPDLARAIDRANTEVVAA